jgi:hypothetical protein
MDWTLEGTFKYVKGTEKEYAIQKGIPIWGAWTNNDINAPLPGIMKDYNKHQTQLAQQKIDPSVKVDTFNYNNGKWLTLTKGKKITYPAGTPPIGPKTEPNTYEIVEIADSFIIYEKGEIWAGFNYLEFRPKVKYKFPFDRDNLDELYSESLEEYAQTLHTTNMKIKYNYIGDTLTAFGGSFNDTLRRVREGMICETWSNIKGAEKPDPKKVRTTAGEWYDFKLEKGKFVDEKYVASPVGGYTWEKVTINKDGTAEVLSGRADINHFDDTLYCYIEKKVKIDAEGKLTEETFGLDEKGEEIKDFDYKQIDIIWSDYNKTAGTITLNGKQFYKASKAAMNGTWSTHKSAPPLPDAKREDVREAIAENYKEPVEWFKFESAKGEFTRLSWHPEDGYLIQTGTYKNIGTSQIVLENIKGTYYDSGGKTVFENELWEYQSLILDFHEAFGGEIYISGVGRVYKAS